MDHIGKGSIIVNGVKKKFSSLVTREVVKESHEWDATLEEIDTGIDGFQDIEISRNGSPYFNGHVLSPNRKVGPSGRKMLIGGLGRLDKLRKSITPREEIRAETPEYALSRILSHEDNQFSIGVVETFNPIGTSMVHDTALEFLTWELTNMCLVYEVTAEIEDQLSTDNMDFPRMPMRASFFWCSANICRFYVIAYDTANTKLQYNFTSDGVTWNGWNDFAGATPGVNVGDNGGYGIYWDNDTPLLHMIVEDAAGWCDYWTGTIDPGTGVITAAQTSNNFEQGTLICGPVPDNQGDIWCAIDDGANDVLWEYAAAAWGNRANGANAVKAMVQQGTDGDMVVIEWDAGEGDLEEYLWDRSAGTYAHAVDVVTAIANDHVGALQIWSDSFLSINIVYEDVTVAGAADLYHTHRHIDDATWETEEQIVNDPSYKTLEMFSLTGDDSGNLYLFYGLDTTGADADLYVLRKYGGSWGTDTLLDADLDDARCIDTPWGGPSVNVFYRDTDDDAHFTLMDLHAVQVVAQYHIPPFYDDFENATDFDGSSASSGCSIKTTNTENPNSGSRNLKATIPAYYNLVNACKYEAIATHGITELCYMSAQKVKFTAMPDDGENIRFFQAGENKAGWGVAYVGCIRDGDNMYWWTYYRHDAGGGEAWVPFTSATTAYPGREYDVEVAIYRNAGAGYVKCWVNGVLVIDRTVLDNDDRQINYANFGLLYSYAGTSELSVYMDDCMISSTRIGPIISGNFRSGQHDADPAIIQWGYLRSEGHPDRFTVWDVLKAGDNSVLLNDQAVPVDMNAAGLSVTETAIKIQPYMTVHPMVHADIYEIEITEVIEQVDIDLDYDNALTKAWVLADILGGELQANEDNTIDLLNQIGSDKSDDVILKTSRSHSVQPTIRPNITIVDWDVDWLPFANRLKIIGAGTAGVDRIEVDVLDALSEYDPVWDTETNLDLVTSEMAQTWGELRLSERKLPVERLIVKFLDLYDTGIISIGITLRCVAEEIELDSDVRVMELMRSYDGAGKEEVYAVLDNLSKGQAMIERIDTIGKLERWIRA